MRYYISTFKIMQYATPSTLLCSVIPNWYKIYEQLMATPSFQEHPPKNPNIFSIKNFYIPEDIGAFNTLSCAKCDHKITTCPKTIGYYKYLNNKNFSELMNALEDFADAQCPGHLKQRKVVLLVNEPSDIPCGQRHVLTQWFHDNDELLTDIPVPQYFNPNFYKNNGFKNMLPQE